MSGEQKEENVKNMPGKTGEENGKHVCEKQKEKDEVDAQKQVLIGAARQSANFLLTRYPYVCAVFATSGTNSTESTKQK